MNIEAENPESEDSTEVSLLTVGDLIQQLQQYDPSVPVRTAIRVFDEDEGTDVEDIYDLMYTEEMVDNDPESETHGKNIVAVVCDMRTPEDDEDFDGEDADGED